MRHFKRLLTCTAVGVATTLMTSPILAQQSDPHSAQAAQVAFPRIPVTHTVIYGSGQREQVDIYEPADAVEELPLILFIHGGNWSFGSHKNVDAKPSHFISNGYYFASAGYRLFPDVTVEQQAADLGAALRALRGNAFATGFDPDRIVLMGFSAGAHLAALLASDPTFAGEAFDAIQGVVLLDGAGYDVPVRIAEAGPRSFQIFTNVFGREPARQAALSPITHVGEVDAPNWLALYDEDREVSQKQSQALIDALTATGANATALPIAQTNHRRMNRDIGRERGKAQTEAIDTFLKAIFG